MMPAFLGVCLAAILAAPSHGNPATQVIKVEPPGWWAAHSINPVRLLIRGEGLRGARVESATAGLRPGAAKVSASGSYLFVDLHIAAEAAPGRHVLTVVSPAGRAEASFEVYTPLPPAGRFQGFSSADVVYLLMPDRFSNGDASNDDPAEASGLFNRDDGRYYHGGDLQGIIDGLPYLKELGVTALWLTPFYDNSNNLLRPSGGTPYTDYHGYGAVDYYAVDEHYGDLAKLRELVDQAHSAGIKIIQDQVANHVGPHHPWVEDPPTPTWFHGTPRKHLSNDFQKWTLADPYAVPALRKAALEGWYFDILPDLNQGDPEVERYLIQNTLWWIGVSGLDGIRQDTLFFAPRPFWRNWMAAIKREYPSFTVVGETFDSDPSLVAFFQGGREGYDGVDTGIDAVFDFPLLDALTRVLLEGAPAAELAKALSRDHLYPRPDRLVTFLGLHDLPRFMSRPEASVERLKLAFAFLLTTRGIPLIYYGDEIAMRGGDDPDNRKDFPGGWAGDRRSAFVAEGRTAEEQDAFTHVRRLLRLRAELEPLRRGRLVNVEAGKDFYAYARATERETALVLFNAGAKARSMELDLRKLGVRTGSSRVPDRLGRGAPARVKRGVFRALVPGRSVGLYVLSAK